MRDLNKFACICMRELDEIGVPYRNAKFVINNRAVRRWGQCSYKNSVFTIQISSVLLDEYNSEKGLKKVIIHELLHTCVGCMNHGENWKKWADLCRNTFGYDITRCDSEKDLGVVRNSIKESRPVYKVCCRSCGTKYIFYRKCDTVKYPELWNCGKCGGKLCLDKNS